MIQRKSKHEYRVVFGSTSFYPYTNDKISEVLEWCTDTFGPSVHRNNCRWRYGWVDKVQDTFYFRNEKDALFFVLRWS